MSDNLSASDEDLIGRIAQGDRLAMQVLFARHQVRLYRFVPRFVGTQAAAEDAIAQLVKCDALAFAVKCDTLWFRREMLIKDVLGPRLCGLTRGFIAFNGGKDAAGRLMVARAHLTLWQSGATIVGIACWLLWN